MSDIIEGWVQMPRYFFHFRDGDDLIGDKEGSELADPDAAQDEAIKAAREAVAERIVKGQLIDGEFFEIRDESGNLVGQVTLKDVVRMDHNVG